MHIVKYIYAYELYAFSTATIVYYGHKPKSLYREYLDRQREKKELLYWLIKSGNDYSHLKFFSTEALKFDPEMVDEYLSDLIFNPDNCESIHGEIDFLYDDMCLNDKENWKRHIDEIDALIANPNILNETGEY